MWFYLSYSQISSSEAELANKQEQLQTITEKLQSISSDSASAILAIDNQQVKKLEEKVKEVEQERTNLKKVLCARASLFRQDPLYTILC